MIELGEKEIRILLWVSAIFGWIVWGVVAFIELKKHKEKRSLNE
jgi:hypothetical protein